MVISTLMEFTADGDITTFVANDILIYYVVGDNLYRSYRPSGTTDYINSVPGISALYPLTNNKLAWIVDQEDVIVANPEVDGAENISTEYIIDVDAKTTSELPSDEWDEIVTSQLEANREYFAAVNSEPSQFKEQTK